MEQEIDDIGSVEDGTFGEGSSTGNPLNSWPSGTRDVTEFPTFVFDGTSTNVELVSPKAHLKAFLALDGVDATDYPRQLSGGGLGNSDQRARSYRKLYERLGLIFRDGEKIRLSEIGLGLRDFPATLPETLENYAEGEKQRFVQNFRSKAIRILAKDQLDNPTEIQRHRLPPGCDVFPFRCIWQAMLELDNKLHYEEVNRCLLYVMKMADLPAAIDRIRTARNQTESYAEASTDELSESLGLPVFEDQASARVSSWFSLAGWGGLIIEQGNQTDGFRHLVPEAIPLIRDELSKPPTFYSAQDEVDWFDHYLRTVIPRDTMDATPSEFIEAFKTDLLVAGLQFDEETTNRFVASCQTKAFVILTGLSGAGKTKLAQAFARWLSPRDGSPRYEIIAVGPDWTSKDYVLGYPDALDSTKYVRTQVLNMILRAAGESRSPFVLVFDEMNLSHVERYFADILSSLESNEAICLHNDLTDRDGIPARISSLPPNLFIIGTVNVDDTTYMFSPKVLDRANVIEFRVDSSSMRSFLDGSSSVSLENLDGKGAIYARSFVESCKKIPSLEDEEISIVTEEIMLVFRILEYFGYEFGYRTASEMKNFIAFHKALTPTTWRISAAIDAQVFQKVLPKLHGSRRKIEPLLTSLAIACHSSRKWADDAAGFLSDEVFQKAIGADSSSHPSDPLETDEKGRLLMSYQTAIYPLSLAKLQRMLRGLEDGFTSFAEA
ncbi:MAG: AAA family ATPase [Pyrinomonadaceae bacterium]